MLIDYSKWIIDDSILDRFESIARPRRRFFQCWSGCRRGPSPAFRAMVCAWFLSIARPRRRLFGCFIIPQKEVLLTVFWRGLHRLRDRDVDFSDAHQVLKMSNGRQYFGLVHIDCETETSTFWMLYNTSKWGILDSILDRFQSIAIPRRRFFGCSSITQNE